MLVSAGLTGENPLSQGRRGRWVATAVGSQRLGQKHQGGTPREPCSCDGIPKSEASYWPGNSGRTQTCLHYQQQVDVFRRRATDEERIVSRHQAGDHRRRPADRDLQSLPKDYEHVRVAVGRTHDAGWLEGNRLNTGICPP